MRINNSCLNFLVKLNRLLWKETNCLHNLKKCSYYVPNGDVKFSKFLVDAQPAKPLLKNGECDEESLACGDGTCLPALYFCDGSVDCPDGSDEGWCGKRKREECADIYYIELFTRTYRTFFAKRIYFDKGGGGILQ